MKLSELIDINELKGLCESFTAQSRAVTAILDLDGNILVATGWQDICTCFHRVHPLTAQRCRESDTVLAGQLRQGEKYNVYKCKNGLVDVAVPIIVEDEHIANFFTGQFFFEAPDREYFFRQAELFGFDKEAYIEALDRVPVFSEAQVRSLMEFFSRLTRVIAKMGLAQKRQNETLSQLQESQQQLEILNTTLEQRVDTAVTELRIKDQLMIQQSKQAAMGEMINNIAHQWKQPLNSLGLIVQAMANGTLGPGEIEPDSRLCLQLIDFMSQTIDDFRSFFRTDKGRSLFSMRQSIARALLIMSASLKDSNISVTIEPGEEVQAVGYPNEYSQVILNLLANARDVLLERKTARPAIKVRIFTEAEHAVVTVSDNGGGISPEAFSQIFAPNFTTKEFAKGSGIGLFMSKIIIEQHMNGSLTADNIEGGACFRIEVLAARPAEVPISPVSTES